MATWIKPSQENLLFPWGTQRNLKGDLKLYRHHFNSKNKMAGRLMVRWLQGLAVKGYCL